MDNLVIYSNSSCHIQRKPQAFLNGKPTDLVQEDWTEKKKKTLKILSQHSSKT